jgi:hypothetical protein
MMKTDSLTESALVSEESRKSSGMHKEATEY